MANKKIDAISALGQNVYCVLSDERSFDEQLTTVFDFKEGAGYSAQMTDNAILIRDYFHGETVAKFKIISITDTNMDVSLKWNPA